VPKIIAEQYGIEPGDEIEWVPAGDVIRVVPADRGPKPGDRKAQLRLFDQAMKRYRAWAAGQPPWSPCEQSGNRGWRREDLYDRGRSR